jgi:hypothetical protein
LEQLVPHAFHVEFAILYFHNVIFNPE